MSIKGRDYKVQGVLVNVCEQGHMLYQKAGLQKVREMAESI